MDEPVELGRTVNRIRERAEGTAHVGKQAGRGGRGLQREGGIIPGQHRMRAIGLDEQRNRCRGCGCGSVVQSKIIYAEGVATARGSRRGGKRRDADPDILRLVVGVRAQAVCLIGHAKNSRIGVGSQQRE